MLNSWIKEERYGEFQNLKRGILPRFEDLGFKDTDFQELAEPGEPTENSPLFKFVLESIDDVMTECDENILLRGVEPRRALDGAFSHMAQIATGGRPTREVPPQMLDKSMTAQLHCMFFLHQSVLAYWKKLDDDKDLREYASFDCIRHIGGLFAQREQNRDLIASIKHGSKPSGPSFS